MAFGRVGLSWTATAVFVPVFGLILLVFDVAQRVASLFAPRAQEHVAGALQWTLVQAYRICGTHFDVERSPEVRPWTSYIIVANHQSMFDIAILGSLFYSNFPKYISKRSLGRWIPSVSYNLRRGGHILIDRNDGAAAITAIRALGRSVHGGRCSGLIFPEGTRARHGELGGFKPAGITALLNEAPDTPVVAVTIDRSWQLLQHNGLPVPFGVCVRVRIAPPIARAAGEDRQALIECVRRDIGDTLARWRSADAATAVG